MSEYDNFSLGAVLLPDQRGEFRVWAPHVDHVDLHLIEPENRTEQMKAEGNGYYHLILDHIPPGTLYTYVLKGDERPDPASRFQPQSVHGPSQVISQAFEWTDQLWFGPRLSAYIIYELHIGTFSPEGTFDGVIARLDSLIDLGITAIEILPIAQFPGDRNWGYDGAAPYAVQNSYGGPEGLKRLVDACHQQGIAVILDVVYNHLGPEGNYLSDFGPYFTERYHTGWGAAINFDGPQSDEVRRFFISNALYWITEFHIDALRLDATHAYLDFSAYPFLQELATEVHVRAEQLNRHVYLFAESDRADDRTLRTPEQGGYGIDAQWSDDLHHVLHTLLTGELMGYYKDFGKFSQLAMALRWGYVYSGDYSEFHQRRHGTLAPDLPAHRFVVATQNHDQVGNRMLGERLSQLTSFDELKVAAAIVLLSPYLPLLFMGEEYGETAPFLYFTSHTDHDLAEAVRQGRREEFTDHQWEGEPPDPQSEDTFLRSKLNHDLRRQGHHQVLFRFYRELMRLRKTHPALRELDKNRLQVVGYDREHVIFMHRWHNRQAVFAAFALGDQAVELTLPVPGGCWRKLLDSTEYSEKGTAAPSPFPTQIEPDQSLTFKLSPHSIVLFESEA